MTMDLSYLRINDHFIIPASELQWAFMRSSGAGGQNVNKVNSQVELRWNFTFSNSVPEKFRSILTEKLQKLITNEGELIIRSQSSRDQLRNREDCLEKLRQILTQALHKPKKRIPTKPSKASKKRRLESKRSHSEKKRWRQKV